MINIPDDIPKYKKKSTRHPPKKSKHKHTYEDCLLKIKIVLKYNTGERIVNRLHLGNYCTICGKIGNITIPTIEGRDNSFRKISPNDMILEDYKHLEIFEIDDFCDKYVTLSN